jgi:hypothetical protein
MEIKIHIFIGLNGTLLHQLLNNISTQIVIMNRYMVPLSWLWQIVGPNYPLFKVKHAPSSKFSG